MGTGNYSAEFYWCLPENKNERVQQIKLNCSMHYLSDGYLTHTRISKALNCVG